MTDGRIEEIESDSGSEGMPELEAATNVAAPVEVVKKPKQSRGEKKARKSVARLGLNPVRDVTRVCVRSGQILYTVENADVFKASKSMYVVFGRIIPSDLSQNPAAQALSSVGNAMAGAGAGAGADAAAAAPAASAPAASAADAADAGELPENIKESDVNLVMTQASCSRENAVAALKDTNGDVVNAIMQLTVS